MTFSIITRYEILRGLHAKNATAQLAAFDRLCSVNTVLPLTDAVVIRAATIYADLYQGGALIGDADISPINRPQNPSGKDIALSVIRPDCAERLGCPRLNHPRTR
ncbi:hypothetical protein [Chloroflexus sp.]|uniref:hypothetical protein n=1 Tax=Chloroflexus sp. TaxID=1904827 RepID=UPI002ACD8A1B|nr:hypothetical protein [Chloroflexus sp.]